MPPPSAGRGSSPDPKPRIPHQLLYHLPHPYMSLPDPICSLPPAWITVLWPQCLHAKQVTASGLHTCCALFPECTCPRWPRGFHLTLSVACSNVPPLQEAFSDTLPNEHPVTPQFLPRLCLASQYSSPPATGD